MKCDLPTTHHIVHLPKQSSPGMTIHNQFASSNRKSQPLFFVLKSCVFLVVHQEVTVRSTSHYVSAIIKTWSRHQKDPGHNGSSNQILRASRSDFPSTKRKTNDALWVGCVNCLSDQLFTRTSNCFVISGNTMFVRHLFCFISNQSALPGQKAWSKQHRS